MLEVVSALICQGCPRSDPTSSYPREDSVVQVFQLNTNYFSVSGKKIKQHDFLILFKSKSGASCARLSPRLPEMLARQAPASSLTLRARCHLGFFGVPGTPPQPSQLGHPPPRPALTMGDPLWDNRPYGTRFTAEMALCVGWVLEMAARGDSLFPYILDGF